MDLSLELRKLSDKIKALESDYLKLYKQNNDQEIRIRQLEHQLNPVKELGSYQAWKEKQGLVVLDDVERNGTQKDSLMDVVSNAISKTTVSAFVPVDLKCSICGDKTIGRQWANCIKGHGLCHDCMDALLGGGCHEDESLFTNFGLRGYHFDLNLNPKHLNRSDR